MEHWEQVPNRLAEQGWLVCENWLKDLVVPTLAEDNRQR